MVIIAEQVASLDRPRGSKQVVSIQYLRALAAFAVVASHTHPIFAFGQCGVDVFFVISGYIMWMIASQNPAPGSFVLARVTRIVPLYWIATIIMGLHQHAPVQAIVKSMLFIPFIGEQDQIWPVLVQGWTLNYEMYFYLIVAFSLLVPLAWRLQWLLSIIIVLSAAGAIGHFSNSIAITYSNPLLLEFGFGMALFSFRDRLPAWRLAAPILIIGGAMLDIMLPEPALLGISRVVTWGIPGALVVAGALSLERTWIVRRVGILLLLGEASYAVYLFHPFVLKTVIQKLAGWPPLVGTVGVILVSTAVGVAVTIVLERPMLSALRRATLRLGPAKRMS